MFVPGSFFEDRVFLAEESERAFVCKLLTDVISFEEFVESEAITSPNGNLVVELVERLSLSWPEETPKPYKELQGVIFDHA